MIFLLLVFLFVIFTLWLGSIILGKAGFDKRWVFCLLIPVVNIIMIWVFALSSWPSENDDEKQGSTHFLG